MMVVALTHLDLADLETKTYGIYQRLRVLLESAVLTGTTLRVVCCAQLPADVPDTMHAARARQSLQQIWGIDAEVICIRLAEPPDEPWILQQTKSALAYRWRPVPRSILESPSLQAVRAAVSGADLVLVHRLPFMVVLQRSCGFGRAPVLFDLDDIEYLTLARHARTHPSPREKVFIRLGLLNVYRATWRAIRQADCTLVCSDIDRNRLSRSAAGSGIHVLPNSVCLPDEIPPVPARAVVMMVGVWSFRPNADGADYFIEQAWGGIRDQVPGAELWLVGASPESLRSFSRAPAGVRFLGFVPDLPGTYREARLVVCPIRSGGGTRLKLLEAAAYGRPIVSSTIGAEGIGFAHEQDAFIRDLPDGIIQACVALLRDDQLAARLARNARELVARHYAKPRIVAGLACLIGARLPQRGPVPPIPEAASQAASAAGIE